ncbi:MAG TPA: D-TA family PLP-dependent enzyme [Gaiellaceae bacterium]|jgi:D-serine deaminase-like pyridoxal phosphate-dependent protein|nr:D-TA family PLP-dependent enzyme [Gaiellaceae bacterium]
MDVAALDTPVATVDLDAVERNIARMQGYCDEHGLAFRPHVKTHKLPALAHLQLRAGAVGITCQKLGEAEVMAASGVRDILVTFPIVGAEKAERLAALAREVAVSVAADSAEVARGLSAALAREGVVAGFLVEVDTGFARTGVQTPKAAAELAELVDALPGLRLDGLMTYPTLPGSGPILRAAVGEIRARGLEVRVVSGGGTPTFFTNHEVPEITEVRAGTYVYGDRSCIANVSVPLEDCALRVRATVVSRPTPERGILDAGSKTLTTDPAEEAAGGGHGLIVEYPDARIYALSEEHGHVDLSACAERPEVGEVVTVVPNHACGCTNLHDRVVVHRSGRVIGCWAVAARGRLR